MRERGERERGGGRWRKRSRRETVVRKGEEEERRKRREGAEEEREEEKHSINGNNQPEPIRLLKSHDYRSWQRKDTHKVRHYQNDVRIELKSLLSIKQK